MIRSKSQLCMLSICITIDSIASIKNTKSKINCFINQLGYSIVPLAHSHPSYSSASFRLTLACISAVALRKYYSLISALLHFPGISILVTTVCLVFCSFPFFPLFTVGRQTQRHKYTMHFLFFARFARFSACMQDVRLPTL